MLRLRTDVGLVMLVNPDHVVAVTVVPARSDQPPHDFDQKLGWCAHLTMTSDHVIVLHDRDLDRLYKRLEHGDPRESAPAVETTRGPFLVEEDRFVVLLQCGEWTQTRRPDDKTWYCKLHGDQPVALSNDGTRAVLTFWEYYDKPGNARQ